MKKTGFKWLPVFLFLMLYAPLTWSQISFLEIRSEQDWITAIEKSRQNNKLLFLDIYATWCGPCKYLENTVYPDPVLGEYYNSNFINIKLDGETEFGRSKVVQFALTAYPSMYFLTPEEEILATLVGVRQAPDLKVFGQKVISSAEKIKEYSAMQKTGNLGPSGLLEYRNLLIEMGATEKANSISESILPSLTEEDYFNPVYKEIVINSPSDLDGKSYITISSNMDRVDSLWTAEEKDQFFSSVFDASLFKAVSSGNENYRDRILNEFLPLYLGKNPDALFRAKYITNKLYDANTGNWEGFEQRIWDMSGSEAGSAPGFLYSEAYDILNNYSQSSEALSIATRLMDKAVASDPGFDNLVMQCYLSGITGDFEKAKLVLGRIESMELSEEQTGILNELKNLVSRSEEDNL